MWAARINVRSECFETAWALFRRGRLKEAKAAADELGGAERDLQLEIAIAIESGEWESLAQPLSAFLDEPMRPSRMMVHKLLRQR
jgi:hypothetical protein